MLNFGKRLCTPSSIFLTENARQRPRDTQWDRVHTVFPNGLHTVHNVPTQIKYEFHNFHEFLKFGQLVQPSACCDHDFTYWTEY